MTRPRQKSDHGFRAFARSVVDPRPWAHVLRMVAYYNCTHVEQRRRVTMGRGVRMAPNVSLRNGERIEIGAYSHVGERSSLWAGNSTGRVRLGDYALLGPEVFITASDYQFEPGTPVMNQPKNERDVVVGNDVWLGARVFVAAGVQIGDGCIVGAGSIVTKSLPPDSIAVGNPARVIGRRTDGVSLHAFELRPVADVSWI